MVKIYKQPFAHGGDAIAIPDASQPDGKMSSADGWTPDYQLPKTDPNYKPVGRQEMNGVFKEVTEALGQMQVQGAASWSADGAPYPINAQVYHGGKQWIALRANSVEPAEGADWTQLSGAVIKSKVDKTSVKQVTGTSTTDIMSQKATTDALNLKADTSDLNTKANTSTTVIAGTGLSGGGNLSANLTLSLDASHTPIGSGQTWQNVLASRSLETTYTNSTGRAIMISVTAQAQSGGLKLSVAGVVVAGAFETANNAPQMQMSAIVPSGASYVVTRDVGTVSKITRWSELR